MKKLVGILTAAGAINWLIVTLFNGFNLVEFIFRADWLIAVVYVLVGLSGIVFLVGMCSGSCRNKCGKCDSTPKAPESNNSEMGEEPQM